MADTTPEPKPEVPVSISFDQIKSPDFRVYHVDGVWGGMSPNTRYLNMAVFTERFPIPRQVTYKVDGEAVTDEIVGRVTRSGLVRELMAELVFDIDTAEVLVGWLQTHIKKARETQAVIGKKQ